MILRLLCCCVVAGGVALAANGGPSDAEIAGGNLARQVTEARPSENVSFTGVLKIKVKGKTTEIPVKVQSILMGPEWQSIYETLSTSNGLTPAKLVITHRGTNASRYELNAALLSTSETATAFAGSDFSAADLGLEFFHWSGQRVLKRELRSSVDCTVLESSNPASKAGDYTRVVSWLDRDSGGIVHAEAFVGSQKVKVFEPKEFKKVNGQWQLQQMQIQNLPAGSRTRLELDLESK